MQISWFGYSAFRIQNDGTTVITDPSDAGMNFSISKHQADIVVCSTSDISTDPIGGKPFIITTPGEYEVKSVFVHGIRSNSSAIYLITVDDIGIAFMGHAKFSELSEKQLEVMEGADILLMPVGGGSASSAKDAVRIINQIEPRIVVPSYYRISGSKGLDSVEVFLKEYQAAREETEKLKVNKKDLMQEDTRVVILKKT